MPGLDVDSPLPRLAGVAIGVLVGDRDGQPVAQLVDGLVDRGGMGEFGEDHELHVEERLVADHRPIHHAQESADPAGDLVAMPGTGKVGLAGRGVVAWDLVHVSSEDECRCERRLRPAEVRHASSEAPGPVHR